MFVRSVPSPNFRGPDVLTIGDEATIAMASMAAVDDEALSEMSDLQMVGDDVGLNLLQREGRTFMLDEGTRVLVIDTRFTTVMVRALEGRNAGKPGGCSMDYSGRSAGSIRPTPPSEARTPNPAASCPKTHFKENLKANVTDIRSLIQGQ